METNFLEQRKDAIAVHALDVFEKQGYTNTSMKDIMIKAEVSRGGLYGHFSNISEVFIHALKIHDEKTKIDLKEPYSLESLLEWIDITIDNSMNLTQAISEFMFTHSSDEYTYLEKRVLSLQSNLQEYLKNLKVDSTEQYSIFIITVIDGILINAHHNDEYLNSNKEFLKQSLINTIVKE